MSVEPRYRLSGKAEADLVDIARYTLRKHGVEQQRRYIDGLYTFFEIIAVTPKLGHSAPQISPHTRVRRYEKDHLVYYRIVGQMVEIARVLHGKQEQRSAFKG